MDQRAEIEAIRRALFARVEEWVGSDVPSKGTEDYKTWQLKLMDVEDVQSIGDLVEYLQSERVDVAEFIIEGGHDLVLAGMDPTDIPWTVIEALGEEVDAGSGMELPTRTYVYGGRCFALRSESNDAFDVFDDAHAAVQALGVVVPTAADDLQHASEAPAPATLGPSTASTGARRGKAPSPKLIIVTEWPGGTMAFKFGDALRTSLRVRKGAMTLVQFAPERIFRVVTSVTEQRFRINLASRDVSCPGRVIFVDL